MRKSIALGFIFLAVMATYGVAVRNGFVWDDQALVLRDPLIRSWRLVPEAFNHYLFLDATASSFYRPLQRLSYTLDYALFAFRPAGYHAMSILYHGLAGLALFLCLEELLRRHCRSSGQHRVVAFAATLIWAVHPLFSSAVFYVAGRADPLAAMFGFAGLYFCLRSERKDGPRKIVSLVLGLLSFLAAALSKESALVFPALWIISLLLERRRPSILPAIAVAALVVVTYSVLRLGADHVPPPAPRPVPSLVRPIIVARAVAEYAGLIVFPLNLRMERDVETRSSGFHEASITHASWRELQTVLGALIIAGLAWWIWRAHKRDRAELTLLLAALLAYLPIGGILSLNATVAEHWLYVPLAFFLAAGVQFAVRWGLRQPRWIRLVALGAIGVWCLFLGVRTFLRADDWREHRTFLERTIAQGGNSVRMLINLAADQLRKGELDQARATVQQALQQEPNEPFALINLAAVALREKKFPEAREILTRAVEIPLISAHAHEALAVVEYQEHGRVDLRRLHLATRTGTPSWNIEKRYLEVLVQSGMREAAIQELRRVLQTEWYRGESWSLLSRLLKEANRFSEAEAAQTTAQRYDVHLRE